MIKGFRSKGLRQLFDKGSSAFIQKALHARCQRRLDALNSAKKLQDLNVPGFDFHALKGFKPQRFTMHVNGPWCITFEFDDGHAYSVDFEQYH